MNRNRLLVPDGQTVAGGGFGTVDGHFAFDHLDPHAAFRGNLVNRAQKLQQLGVKASKQLDKALVEQAQESAKLGLSASEPRDESE